MKNIVWQLPGGRVAVHHLDAAAADSQARAQELVTLGQVDAGWVAVAFDVNVFPQQDQQFWIWEEGALTTDSAASLAAKISTAVKRMTADTDALIAAVIGNRGDEYILAEKEATAFALAGYTGPVPESVQSWMDAKGWTATAAADDILAMATAWRAAQRALRSHRQLRQEQSRNAADAAGVDAALAQWAGFLTAIKGQLGV